MITLIEVYIQLGLEFRAIAKAETGKKVTCTCIAKARLTATVLFPTPPLQELTAIMCSTLASPKALSGSRGEKGFRALAQTLVIY